VVELDDGEGGDELVIRLIGPVPLPVLYVDALAYVRKDALNRLAAQAGSLRDRRHERLGDARLLPNHDCEVSSLRYWGGGGSARVGGLRRPMGSTTTSA